MISKETLTVESVAGHAASTADTLSERLYHASDILSSPTLAASLTAFVNQGFKSAGTYDPTRWDLINSMRFKRTNEINELLGTEGLFAVLYDGKVPVACAAAVPWAKEYQGCRLPGEEGWEIKTVCVDAKWVKRGLASRSINILRDYLVEQERAKLALDGAQEAGNKKLKFWLEVAECVNGEYWRRRGYKELRGYDRPAGLWSSLTGFRLLVMVKDIDVYTATNSPSSS
ncbi:hypothetical protein K504DRAFT_297023 [Pleomassaria siparia CBS 279.74]|uniref:N-acetyltransferase domain-containing protein n=1 Tax=Pleomassaria siparia CBS 279.74 TaxID=1314801 RepID=A0A6G1K5W1_9PLEO|nr:hypothetical protein K504DRAFT_297023 [Pleomassaria siparia CBS 279.74]